MKHTLQAVYERGRGWVKNAGKFVHDHPLLMAGGGIIGSAIFRLAAGPTLPPSRGQRNEMHHMPASSLRREAYASSNTFSERPVLLGNLRGI